MPKFLLALLFTLLSINPFPNQPTYSPETAIGMYQITGQILQFHQTLCQTVRLFI